MISSSMTFFAFFRRKKAEGEGRCHLAKDRQVEVKVVRAIDA